MSLHCVFERVRGTDRDFERTIRDTIEHVGGPIDKLFASSDVVE